MAAAVTRLGGPFAMAAASKVGPQQARPRTTSAPNAWSAANDKWLWDHRNAPVFELGRRLGRGDGAIEARLKHLHDPSHAAYQRLFQKSGTAPTAADAASKRLFSSAELNEEQSRAVALASEGESFFLTGGAGTGKSHTLGHVVSALRKRHGARGVFVTGSTGSMRPAP